MTTWARMKDFTRRVLDPREQPPEFEIETAKDCAAVGGALGLLFGVVYMVVQLVNCGAIRCGS